MSTREQCVYWRHWSGVSTGDTGAVCLLESSVSTGDTGAVCLLETLERCVY